MLPQTRVSLINPNANRANKRPADVNAGIGALQGPLESADQATYQPQTHSPEVG